MKMTIEESLTTITRMYRSSEGIFLSGKYELKVVPQCLGGKWKKPTSSGKRRARELGQTY